MVHWIPVEKVYELNFATHDHITHTLKIRFSSKRVKNEKTWTEPLSMKISPGLVSKAVPHTPSTPTTKYQELGASRGVDN